MLYREGRETAGEEHAVHVCVAQSLTSEGKPTACYINSQQVAQPSLQPHAPVPAAVANTKLTVAPELGPALGFLQTLYISQGQALKDHRALNGGLWKRLHQHKKSLFWPTGAAA